METHQTKTIHQFSTTSPRAALAIERLLRDPKCILLLELFDRLRTPKRKNVLLRVAGYMAEKYLPWAT
jgi:hypothetical protein